MEEHDEEGDVQYDDEEGADVEDDEDMGIGTMQARCLPSPWQYRQQGSIVGFSQHFVHLLCDRYC